MKSLPSTVQSLPPPTCPRLPTPLFLCSHPVSLYRSTINESLYLNLEVECYFFPIINNTVVNLPVYKSFRLRSLRNKICGQAVGTLLEVLWHTVANVRQGFYSIHGSPWLPLLWSDISVLWGNHLLPRLSPLLDCEGLQTPSFVRSAQLLAS